MLAGVGCENCRYPQALVPETQSLGNTFVISINRVAKCFSVVGNHGICQFVIVQDSPAAGRPMDNVDAVGAAVVCINCLLDLLIASKRDGGSLPAVETHYSARLRR